ncbi:hypothetical protein oki101_04720 [Helicobacter pylori]
MRCVYWGEGLKWQEPNPKELFNLGIKSYKEQDFSQKGKREICFFYRLVAHSQYFDLYSHAGG